MATSSKIKEVLNTLWHYARSKVLLSLLLAYMVFSVFLLAATGIDICVPCIITLITGHHCPGCGLTSATIDLVKFDVPGAWDHNPMVFIVLPAAAFFVASDFYRFVKQRQQSHAPQASPAAGN